MNNILDSQLKNNQVHVWQIDLELSTEQINNLFTLLSKDERERANKFHFERDKTRFVAARGSLRRVLSRYVGVAAERLQFNYNAYGKPGLLQAPELQFNLSHANSKALIAVSHAAVGIDIEYSEKELDIDGIAKRFFSVNEYQLITSLSGVKKRKAFFTGWVRKEAFLKALGQGLSYALAKVEVTLLPEQPAQIIALHDEQQNLADWSMFALAVPVGYEAALVVKAIALSLELKYFEY